jgi:hypothetical protein
MNKKMNEIIIGEGEELIENWNYGFETIDSTLNNFITEAAEFKIKIDWSNIIKTIFNISNIKKNYKPERCLDIYELVEDLNVSYENYEVDYPGGGQVFITISAQKENLNNIKESLNSLIKILEELWINNGVNVMSFKKIIEIKNDNINHLSNKIIENDKKIEIFNKESTQKTKIIDELILIMSFILHPTDLFYKNGSILITKDKTLLKIINYQNNIEQDYINDLINFLKRLQFNIVEVNELGIDKSELSHITILQMGGIDGLRGWSQENTLLECLNNDSVDPLKIREDYLIWSKNVNK